MRLNYNFEEKYLWGPSLCLYFAFLLFLTVDFIAFLRFNVKNLMACIYQIHLQLMSALFPSKASTALWKVFI